MAFSFGAPAQKPPALNLFGNSNTNTANATANTSTPSLFGKPMGNTTLGTSSLGINLNTGLNNQSANQPTQQGLTTSTNNPAIDLTHIRSTTKFDHLQASLQQEIQGLDTAILNMETDCDTALAEVIPVVKDNGSQLAPALDYLSAKLEELENGLENDAEAIMSFLDGEMKHDEAELKCVFRNVDRMKVPRQFQIAGTTVENTAGRTSVLGSSNMNSTGLSGWWNQPQNLRGTRVASGAGSQALQLVNEEQDDSSSSGPKTLVDLFDARTDTFKRVNDEQKRLRAEIEDFVEGLEEKVISKERELNERLNYGNTNAEERREEQKQLRLNQLGFVFGEVQRGLYEVADKVGTTRDGILQLGMMR